MTSEREVPALSPQTGFAPVPWDLYTANGGELDGLPDVDWPSFDGACCPSEWRGPTDQPGEQPFLCCLPPGHPGTHRGSDSVSVVAEWADAHAIDRPTGVTRPNAGGTR